MRELRSCDFCGADAVGTFAIVPPELEPTEAEQRRVVCCGDCKNRLEGLLEPLLARAGLEGASAGETDPTGHRGAEADETGDGGTVVASSDESTQKRQRTSSPNATVSNADDETGPGTDGETDPDSDDPETDSELADGITFERAQTEDGDGSSNEGAIAEPAEIADEGDSTESDVDETSAKRESSKASGSSSDESPSQSTTRSPKAYGKVLRLLQNREFPMERSAVSNLAAGAYDLESHEVDAIIEHALESGEFTEKGDKLHRS